MARRNPRREALEAEVRQAHRYAGQKVSRLETRKGVAIRREGLDPRRNFHDMSTTQLSHYLGTLRAFNSRATNYVRGENGNPIPDAQWRHYQRLERANNQQAERFEHNLHDITTPVPGLGRTPSEYLADRQGIDRRRAGGQWRTFEKVTRNAEDIAGSDELGKLIGGLEKRLDPGYLDKRMRAQRATIKKIMEETGDTGEGSLYNKIANMSNEHLLVLIDETDFMNRLKGKYVFRDSGKPEWQAQVVEDYSGGMSDQVAWIKKQPKVGTEARKTESSGSSRGYTDTNVGTLPVQFNPLDTRVRSTPVQFDPNDTRARSNPIVKRNNGKRGPK